MKNLEEIAYYLYVQGILTRIEIKNLIRDGFIGYLPEYLWNPLEKQLDDLGLTSADRRRTWEYENWEEDYIKRETKIGRELLHVFADRTSDTKDEQAPQSDSLRPRVVDIELDTLQKHLRGEQSTHGRNFAEILSTLSGVNHVSEKDLAPAGDAIASMSFDRFVARLLDLLAGPSGFWKRIWDFVSYDRFLLPHYSGPIVTAFKQILRGFKKNELGQYDWTLRYEEIVWSYYVIQVRQTVLRAMAHLLRRQPDIWAQNLTQEYHPLAFCAGALVYSANRAIRAGHLSNDEALPLAFTVVELAHGKAWACAYHMDSNAIMPFLQHYFRFTYEREYNLGQTMLRELYDHFADMKTDVEKQEFIDNTRALLEQEGEERIEPAICLRQLHALYAHDYFGPLFRGFPPEKERMLMDAWWKALAYDVGGLGVTWDLETLEWKRNIIDFESYLENETFQKLADPILRLFYGICVPATWNG